jgi:protein gp37
MSAKTSISWTDATWSPLRVRVRSDAAQIAEAKGYSSLVQIAGKMAGRVGPHCEHVSPGCANCYSDTNNGRCLPANGTGLPFDRRSRDLVESFIDENILDQPMRWRGSKNIFVDNQSDLFGEWNTDEQIDRMYTVMAVRQQHIFQVLTKRLERALKYHWPLENVWLGVSVENQDTADERIPVLLKIPAAKRFVSYEPALGPVDFTQITHKIGEDSSTVQSVLDGDDGFGLNAAREKLDWIIFGGESGTGARPCNVAWARNTIRQCRESSVACFIKQLGKRPEEETELGTMSLGLRDRKGADMAEWPEDLRVQEFPS